MGADTKSEPRVTHNIKLEKGFVGLAFDEIHLQGLAASVKQLGAELGARYFSVSLDSADDVDHLKTEDPEALGGPAIPEKIGSMHMSFGTIIELPRCSISLSPSRARLTVEGKNAVELRGLFFQLERELQLRKYEFSWMAQLLHSPKGLVLRGIGMVFAVWILYSLLEIFILEPWLPAPGTNAAQLVKAAMSVFNAFAAILTASQLANAFPPVRFQGRFFDFSRRPRRVLYGIMMSVVVPLAVRMLYDLRLH